MERHFQSIESNVELRLFAQPEVTPFVRRQDELYTRVRDTGEPIEHVVEHPWSTAVVCMSWRAHTRAATALAHTAASVSTRAPRTKDACSRSLSRALLPKWFRPWSCTLSTRARHLSRQRLYKSRGSRSPLPVSSSTSASAGRSLRVRLPQKVNNPFVFCCYCCLCAVIDACASIRHRCMRCNGTVNRFFFFIIYLFFCIRRYICKICAVAQSVMCILHFWCCVCRYRCFVVHVFIQ